MKMVVKWFKKSNRWKHLVGGAVIGLFAGSMYTAVYAGMLCGASMEYKDRAHGGKWDWVDLVLTAAGSILGRLAVCWI